MCVIQLGSKKHHRTRHSDSTYQVTKLLRRQCLLPKVGPAGEQLTRSMPNWPSNSDSAENTEQGLAGKIHPTDGSEFNSGTNVIPKHLSSSVSYISSAI